MLTVEHIIESIDAGKFAEIAARYGESAGPEDERRQKYLELPLWIEANLRRAKRIGLHEGPRRRVLDLGCGCGYFLYVCKLLGHIVVGIDRKERRSLFTDVRDLLGVPWVAHSIKAFEPLPDVGRVDVVTAHMVTFNGHKKQPWGAKEWAWMFDAIGAPVVSLELNKEPDGTLYPPGVREMFAARGARIHEHRVLITK